MLECAAREGGGDARVLGWLSMLHRQAAEYAPPNAHAEHVLACEAAARRALALDEGQIEAQTALVSVAPLFGRWAEASRKLAQICEASPGHPVPENDLSVVEMATGQVRAAKRRRDQLIAADPLSAQFAYKSVFQNWSVGNLTEMDHCADRALQLWPFHPAVWNVRFWTLAYSGRFAAAENLLDEACPPAIPDSLRTFLRRVVAAAGDDKPGEAEDVIALAQDHASGGPALGIAAMFALGLFDRTDAMFALATRYYLQSGEAPVPLQPRAGHPQLNEQHRRLTQILFTPVCASMRDDPRFDALCVSIGLSTFWDECGITPDFRA
jgi:hypothetical protein